MLAQRAEALPPTWDGWKESQDHTFCLAQHCLLWHTSRRNICLSLSLPFKKNLKLLFPPNNVYLATDDFLCKSNTFDTYIKGSFN